jgi:hypothetical protein
LVRRQSPGLEASGQESASERTVGNEPDAQLATRREQFALGIAAPQRVLGLERGDRMHGNRAPERRRRCFREPQVTHLAGAHQVRHRADGVLDGHGGIDPVLVVEIDRLDAEPRQ